jgi:hypothetical protein
MRRRAPLLAAATLAATLLVGGTAAAEPGMNQILVPAECDNGEEYTFVVNGEGNVGHLLGSNSNFVVKRYEVSYFAPKSKEPLMTDTYDSGLKTGLEGELVTCTGETTIDHWQLGKVRAVFEFQGFLTS